MAHLASRAHVWRGYDAEQLPVHAGAQLQFPEEVMRRLPQIVSRAIRVSSGDGRPPILIIQDIFSSLTLEQQQCTMECLGCHVPTEEEKRELMEEACAQTQHLPEREREEARWNIAHALGLQPQPSSKFAG